MAKKENKLAKQQQEDVELEQTFHELAPNSTDATSIPEKKSKTGRIVAICVCITVVVLILAAVGGYLFYSQTAPIIDGVRIAGVDVGGMTQKEAVAAVNESLQSSYYSNDMSVTVLESTVTIPSACVQSLDTEKAVRSAFGYGRSIIPSIREQELAVASKDGHDVNLTPYLTLDTEQIKRILGELGQIYSSLLSQSTFEIVGETPSAEDINKNVNFQKLVVNLGVPEYALDMDALYEQVIDAYGKTQFAVTGSCEIITPDPVDLDSILQEHYVAPVDAYLDPDTATIIECSYGYGFDVAAAKTLLEASEYGSTVEIPFSQVQPKYTAETLAATLFKDTLSTYTAKSSSVSSRDENLRVACSTLDGIILNPGQVFSYNEALGERTEERGYKAGATYMNGETVTTIGGGICQLSSSLYYCALVADLEIIMRENHGYAVGYMPFGMDATVSWGVVDFRFRNNTENPIRISASSDGGVTTVSLCGIDDKDYYVEMEYAVTGTHKSETKYEILPPDNKEGYKEGDYIVTPYTGYDVKTYRCKYSKATKELISKEFEADSRYSKRDAVICKIEDPAAATTVPPTTAPQ